MVRCVGPLLLGLFLAACGAPQGEGGDAGIDVAAALGGGDGEGFARAEGPRAFAFPADHGPHPAFRNEWWYLTGNLEDARGRRFGFQVTFFRVALRPDTPERRSAWAVRDVYMGHLALTDGAGGRFFAIERFARGAAGLAGARPDPFRVWLEDWRLGAAATGEGRPWRLVAAEGAVGLDLSLQPEKGPVLQGDDGLSRKGGEAGNASYYYSMPRLAATGELRVQGERFAVAGRAWLDREWSTSALEPGQRGWDWFALQLDDGRDLMFYRLRRDDGSTDPRSAGSLIGADGSVRRLGHEEVELAPTATWESPRGGRYPVAWRLRVPTAGLDLAVRPVLRDQELDLAVRYWEGAVDVIGRGSAGGVAGRGYVELTGYAR